MVKIQVEVGRKSEIGYDVASEKSFGQESA